MNENGIQCILLVEDDAIVAISEIKLLQKYICRILTVATGEEAVRLIEQEPEIDLVLMDVCLKEGMDGIQTARCILERRDLPIVFLTSYTEHEVVEQAGQVNSYGYVVKNSGEAVLIGSITLAHRLFEARRQEQAKEHALREQEARLATVTENTPDTILQVDSAGLITFINHPAPGLSREQVIGTSIYRWVPEAQYPVLAHIFEAAFARGEAGEYESLGPGPYGVQHIYNVRVRPVLVDGKTVNAIYTATDITRYRQTEEALRESETRYRAILETAMDGFWLVDMQGHLLEVNEAYCRLSGFSRAELLQMNINDLDAVETPAETVARQQRVRTLGYDRFESRHRRKDGSLFDIEASLQYQPAHGGRIFGFVRDITERKQAEKALQESQALYKSLVDALPQNLYRIDLDGHLTFINQALEKNLQTPLQEVIGKTAYDIYPPDLAQKYRRDDLQIVQSGAMLTQVEENLSPATGEKRFVEVVKVPIRDLDGKVCGIQGIFWDVTERQRAEQALAEAYREKQALLRELQHRAKNSFALIVSLAGLMESTSQSEEAQVALADLTSRVRAMSELYDLLYAAEAVITTRLDEYCARVAATFQLSGDICLQQTYDPVVVPTKIAAPIGLILTELITNAVKYAFPLQEAGVIAISLRTGEAEAALQVADNGVGIAEDFDIDMSDSLGLVLVQALARQIGGSFQIQRANGTICTITFPVEPLAVIQERLMR